MKSLNPGSFADMVSFATMAYWILMAVMRIDLIKYAAESQLPPTPVAGVTWGEKGDESPVPERHGSIGLAVRCYCLAPLAGRSIGMRRDRSDSVRHRSADKFPQAQRHGPSDWVRLSRALAGRSIGVRQDGADSVRHLVW